MQNTLGIAKPRYNADCNGCGYCCTMEPCLLAQEALKCYTGPCTALEPRDGKLICGLVRNPLGYLFKAAHPEADVPLLDAPPESEAGEQLSRDLAAALGIGKGCDAVDDEDSARWNAGASPR